MSYPWSDEPILDKMARAYLRTAFGPDYLIAIHGEERDAMRAALQVLADNLTDEILIECIAFHDDPKRAEIFAAMKLPKHRAAVDRARDAFARALKVVMA